MIMPGINSKKPRKIQSVTRTIVFRKGRQRLRKIATASRSLTGRKGAAASWVMITAVTPEMTPAEIVIATNFNKPSITSVDTAATFAAVPEGGQYLYHTNPDTIRMVVIIIGTCAIRLSL